MAAGKSVLLAPLLALLVWGCGGGSSGGPDAGLDAVEDAGPDGADPVGDDGGDLDASDAGADAAGLDGGDPGGDPVADGGDEPIDGGDPAADGGDGPADGGDPGCQGQEPFDYTCEAGQPETCPGGMCVLGMCIAPVLDPDRWADCGDALCGPCEDATGCPADCGQPPQMTGAKEYDNATTITVWVHGFYNKSPDDVANMTYGAFEGCGGILGDFATYGTDRPCGDAPPGDTAPDQMVEIEYYGAIPPAWMSQTDIDEVEQFAWDGASALERYARIVAKAIRHKLEISGATHVNLACHSFGCLITRHMIEHDLEGLASENRFVRWFSSAGVIAGARLARLYDNPTVQETAPLIGLELSDFVVMHPDNVQDNSCVWDHKLYEGNNPLLAGMIIHHATATDPHISEAMGIALLDLNNPGDEPNDGIMYTLDEYFHSQADEVAFQAPSGQLLRPTTHSVYVDHMTLPETDSAHLLATANLFHRRKVIIRIVELELLDDRESLADGEHGQPPAEIVAEVEVRYDPYVHDTFGKDVLIHQTTLDQRSPEWFSQAEGTTSQPDYTLFAGPVFDAMDQLHLRFELLEVDWYPRAQVLEWAFDAHEQLYLFDEQVPLTDALIERENQYVRLVVQVEVVALY